MNFKADYSPWPHDFLRSLQGLPDSSSQYEQYLQSSVALKLPPGVAATLARLYYPLVLFLRDRLSGYPSPLVLGINGAQGTGKSTAAIILEILLEKGFGLRTCRISIDDLYITREARAELAVKVHPLLATRGVPGTHNVNLGLRVLESLQKADFRTETVIPRFDKVHDQPFPFDNREIFVGRPDFILFEGWCVGAVPEPPSSLSRPVNELERREDDGAKWRQYVNERLAGYQSLFRKINILVMLKAPSFSKVYEWRALQEKELVSRLSETELRNSRLMNDEELKRFLMHYERLTRWMLKEMPSRADFVFELNDEHAMERVTVNAVR